MVKEKKKDKSMANHAIYCKKMAKSKEQVEKKKYQQFKRLFK